MRKGIFAVFFLLSAGCSLNQVALDTTAGILSRGTQAVYDEPDIELAKDAFPAQLELARILLRNDPSNRALLTSAAEGFNGYAFLFLQDSQPERAKAFYLRGRNFAFRALAREAGTEDLAGLSAAAMERFLALTGEKDAPDLFWAAFGWSSWINLSKDSPQALAQSPQTVAMMRRVMDLDPSFNFAGPEIFFGVYYASRPAILGGDVTQAKKYFEQAIKITQGKYLMDYVLEARYLAVALQDKSFFEDLLRRVGDMPAGRLPGAMLEDQAAKREALALLERTDDYFLGLFRRVFTAVAYIPSPSLRLPNALRIY